MQWGENNLTWDDYYERFYDLSLSTQKSYSYKLTNYDREEANDLALKTFENMEANPNEMTIDWFLEKVLDKATYEESYGIQML